MKILKSIFKRGQTDKWMKGIYKTNTEYSDISNDYKKPPLTVVDYASGKVVTEEYESEETILLTDPQNEYVNSNDDAGNRYELISYYMSKTELLISKVLSSTKQIYFLYNSQQNDFVDIYVPVDKE